MPDILLGGAPKSGTSSVFDWLNAHPEISGSDPKETFYLMDPHHPLCNNNISYEQDQWRNYGSFFKGNGKKLDGSTHYLFSELALSAVNKLESPCKVVFLLREPAERVYSSFQYSGRTLPHLRMIWNFQTTSTIC